MVSKWRGVMSLFNFKSNTKSMELRKEDFFILDENGYRVRPMKGNSLFMFPDDYIILDLETTGLDPLVDDILEIGAIKVVDNVIIEEFQRFCRPDDISMLSGFIQKLTGITPEMLDNAEHPINGIKDFMQFAGDSIILGYNVHFDINFLYDEALTRNISPIKNDLIDVMRFSKRFLSDLPDYKLKTVAQELDIDSTGSHRAIADCKITHNVYQHIKNVIGNDGNATDEFYKKAINKRKPLECKDITTDKTEFDITHPLYGQVCVFTGTLEKMNRKQAMQLVVDFGGENGKNVTRKTNFLVLGNNDYCPLIKDPDGKSTKQLKAEKFKESGQNIEIISENVFYDMLEM